MKKIYYCIADRQNYNQIMETGKNATSLEELKEEILNYISVDYPSEDDGSEEWQDWQSLQDWTVEELVESWEFAIMSSLHKF